MIDYLVKNKEWIFSGIGISILTWAFLLISRFMRNRKNKNPSQAKIQSMNQNNGDKSINIQVGGNINNSFKDNDNGY